MSYHDPIDRSVAWVIEQRLAEAGDRYWKEVSSFPEIQSTIRFSTGPVFLNYEAHPNTYLVLDEPTEAPVDRRSRWEFGLISEEEAMSWHVSATFDGDSARRELDALREPVLAQNSGAGDQFSAARDAVLCMILSGAVGWVGERRFHVVMSGHANPGHAPRDGVANDMVNVSVSQA